MLHVMMLSVMYFQIASEDLGIPTNKIHIREMSTDKVPNSIITGASSTTSLNGAAVHVCTPTARLAGSFCCV